MTYFQGPLIEKSPQSYKRKVKKNMDRRNRFRTQPVTFMEIKEVDEDCPEMNSIGQQSLGVSSTDNNDPAHNSSSSSHAHTNESAGSGLNLAVIAESHREMTRSQTDLKRQFEEFSRNLSFRRTRGVPGSHKKLNSHNHITIPEIALNDENAEAEAEPEVEPELGAEPEVEGSGISVDFPAGFSRKPRPSV